MDESIINLAEFIFESDAIEGIIGDPDSIMKKIQVRIAKMKKRGQNDNWGDGHVGAMLMLEFLVRESVNQYIDKKLICDVQRLIINEHNTRGRGYRLPDNFIGEYRTVNVSVYGRRCPPPELIPSLMEELISGEDFIWWQQNTRNQNPGISLAKIADFHYRFLRVHPFADGNGRTARALAYFMMRYALLKPFIFTSEDTVSAYYPCFDDPTEYTMRQYFLEKFKVYSNR